MAIQTESWVSRIQGNLFQNQDFISKSVDHSAFVRDSIVHLPQAGATPTVVKNRSSFPATIAERTDTDETYSLNNYSTDPIRVRNLDEIQTSYAKMDSVMGEHMDSLNERIGDEVAFSWATATAARVVNTSGSATADALAPGATGTRNALDKADVRQAAKILDLDNVASANRYLLLPTAMYYQLFADTTLISRDFMEKASQEKGVITELYGFKIMIRPTVAVYDVADAVKAVGAATAITDDLGAIFWQQSYVSNALGAIRAYGNENVAEHYGDILSAEVEHGAAKLRTDEKGVGAIQQVG